MTDLAETRAQIEALETEIAVLQAQLDAALRARDEARTQADAAMRSLKTSAQAQVRALNDRAARIARLEGENRDLAARLRTAEAALAEARAGGSGAPAAMGQGGDGPGAGALVARLGAALDGLEAEEAVPACLVLAKLMLVAGAPEAAMKCLAEAGTQSGDDTVLRAQVARGYLALGRPELALQCLVEGALSGFEAEEAEAMAQALRAGLDARP